MQFFRLLTALCAAALFAGALAAPFPDFTYQTDNGPLKMSSLRGKVVYLDYWASWCGPCRQSFPWMNEMQARYGGKGLTIVAVNVDREGGAAQRFLKEHPANFTVAYDASGDTAAQLALQGMPNSFLVDRHGELRLAHVGFREADKKALEEKIRALLDTPK